MSSNIIAFVFARGGSKGLPRKNLLPLSGKPLIVHSIEMALSLSRVSKVVVSTDDYEIADVARKAGAEVPFMRPVELATDTAAEWLAWRHAINELHKNGENFDVFLSLPATAPLRNLADVNCCLDALQNTSCDAVITVREAERSPYFNMVRQNPDSSVQLAIEGRFHRRQDAPVLYDMTTVAYAVRTDFILKAERIFDGKVQAVMIPRERALDIDTEMDMLIAEALIDKVSNVGDAYPL
jgi:CMP-N-acetylneuraminic acid synthetase